MSTTIPAARPVRLGEQVTDYLSGRTYTVKAMPGDTNVHAVRRAGPQLDLPHPGQPDGPSWRGAVRPVPAERPRARQRPVGCLPGLTACPASTHPREDPPMTLCLVRRGYPHTVHADLDPHPLDVDYPVPACLPDRREGDLLWITQRPNVNQTQYRPRDSDLLSGITYTWRCRCGAAPVSRRHERISELWRQHADRPDPLVTVTLAD